MIRTSLINGVINLDSDFSKYIESLSKPGVIEGLNVQDGVVKPGKARVKAERTNGETIYCYVENTEDVSLSGNDGKVYIVIDQEDIDNGLVREDGSNIARIEEGNDRPTKNFLKIWSKTGAIIKDERDIIKKIDEVNEDIEDEISGIDTRLTEAEHDIQQIIEQSGSALSYLDTTCYAGEEIHENDLIVTNGNSFNPDRTDESVSVGGTDNNKYAIGVTGNGNSTDFFAIKTGMIEGVTPENVTVNLETDDNGKPSGTVLATVDINDVFYNGLVSNTFSSVIDGPSISWTTNRPEFWLNSFGKNNYLDGFFMLHAQYIRHQNKIKDKGSFNAGETFYYHNEDGETIGFSNAPRFNCTTMDNIIVLTGTLDGVSGTFLFRVIGDKCVLFKSFEYDYYMNGLSSDGKIKTTGGTNSGSTVTIYVSDTPYNFDNATSYSTNIAYISGTNIIRLLEDIDGEKYIFQYAGTNKINIYKINSDYTVTKINDSYMSCSTMSASIFPGIENGVLTLVYLQTLSSSTNFKRIKFTGNPYYGGTRKIISFDGNIVSGTKEKYRLTIAPTITGSVTDMMKIYDKSGTYYSECAIRDLNSWNNVANRTPYIDGSSIKARYARKVNLNDDCICGGFANGDYTELEPVNYCFYGVKHGFSGLVADTLYYSDGYGGITTESGLNRIGTAVSNSGLLITPTQREDIEHYESYDTASSSTSSFKRYILGNGRIRFMGRGKIYRYVGSTQTYIINSSTEITQSISVSYGDVVEIYYTSYNDSTGADFKVFYELN